MADRTPASLDGLMKLLQLMGGEQQVFNDPKTGEQVPVSMGMMPMGPGKQLAAVNRSPALKKIRDALLGFSDDASRQAGFAEQGYKTSLKVRVKWPDGMEIVDEVKGLTPKHALESAHRNWQGAVIEPLEIIK